MSRRSEVWAVAAAIVAAWAAIMTCECDLWVTRYAATTRGINFLLWTTFGAGFWLAARELAWRELNREAWMAAAAAVVCFGQACILAVLTIYWLLDWPPLPYLSGMRMVFGTPPLLVGYAAWRSRGEWAVVRDGIAAASVVFVLGLLTIVWMIVDTRLWIVG